MSSRDDSVSYVIEKKAAIDIRYRASRTERFHTIISSLLSSDNSCSCSFGMAKSKHEALKCQLSWYAQTYIHNVHELGGATL